jgi:hypothetical protein
MNPFDLRYLLALHDKKTGKPKRGQPRRRKPGWPPHPDERVYGHRMIDIGYKALAMKLHPDKGGSQEDMARLNRVRDRLRWVFPSRFSKPPR